LCIVILSLLGITKYLPTTQTNGAVTTNPNPPTAIAETISKGGSGANDVTMNGNSDPPAVSSVRKGLATAKLEPVDKNTRPNKSNPSQPKISPEDIELICISDDD